MATTLQSSIKVLTELGEENGFVTLEEVCHHTPSLETNPDSIDMIYFALNSKGIPVVDHVRDLPEYTKPLNNSPYAPANRIVCYTLLYDRRRDSRHLQ